MEIPKRFCDLEGDDGDLPWGRDTVPRWGGKNLTE